MGISKASDIFVVFSHTKKNPSLKLLSIRVRNSAAPNEPLNIIFFLPQNRPAIETLWCKNNENPSDRKSQNGAPLRIVHNILSLREHWLLDDI
jgi:hypothetical protein